MRGPTNAAVICGRSELASEPLKLMVYVMSPAFPEEVTIAAPPAPPIESNPFNAVCTAAAVALNASGLVVKPRNVRVNVPLEAITRTV